MTVYSYCRAKFYCTVLYTSTKTSYTTRTWTRTSTRTYNPFLSKLVYGLLSFVVTWETSTSTLLTNRINLIYKYDAWLIFSCHLEKFACAFCSNTYEHFNEVCRWTLDEGDIWFTRNCTSQKGLPSSRSTCEKSTPWNSPLSRGMEKKGKNTCSSKLFYERR